MEDHKKIIEEKFQILDNIREIINIIGDNSEREGLFETPQ